MNKEQTICCIRQYFMGIFDDNKININSIPLDLGTYIANNGGGEFSNASFDEFEKSMKEAFPKLKQRDISDILEIYQETINYSFK